MNTDSILEYLVFRYFAKSIYDYDFLGKCQMLVTNFFCYKTDGYYKVVG